MANYLKNVKDITAPLNWQSAPNSPPTELAYITEEEKNLLLKADLHGSLGDGQPNVGPKGIMSLDGDDVDRKVESMAGKSYGKQMGVTIDTSTKAGQDKKQKFRDRTGSNVVTDKEKKGRKDLGREAADTSAKAGGMSDKEYEKKWGESKEDEEKKKTWLERLNIIGPSIKDPLDQAKIDLIKKAIKNWQENHPNYFEGPPGGFNWLTGIMDSISMGKYRDDDKGFPIGGWSEGMNVAGTHPGSFTREGLEDFIRNMDPDANILGQLKRHNPEVYYSFNDPQTSGGIAELAGLDAQKYAKKYTDDGFINPNYDSEFAQQIFNARMEEDKMKGSGSGGGGFGGGDSGGGGSGGGGSGGGNQFAFAPPGQIGFYNPNINPATGLPYGYQYGTYGDYTPFAQVKDGGIIELGHGGYLNDYAAADSLMFEDPQEKEEWEYNV